MAIGHQKDILNYPIQLDYLKNTLTGMNIRQGGYLVYGEKVVTGTGTVNLNITQIIESVKIINQWAIITEITTLNNLTDLYFDLWDGTNSVKITESGITLSGAPVGSFFTKNKLSTETLGYSIIDQCRMIEATGDIAVPFILSQKSNTNTFVRMNFATTDNPVSFKLYFYISYVPLNGGMLTLV